MKHFTTTLLFVLFLGSFNFLSAQTILYSGDLMFLGYDNRADDLFTNGTGHDYVLITNLVDIAPSTKFLYANVVHRSNTAKPWQTCQNTPANELPVLRFELKSTSNSISAGSVIALHIPNNYSAADATANGGVKIFINNTDVTSNFNLYLYTTYNTAKGNKDLGIINISHNSPDAMFLIQEDNDFAFQHYTNSGFRVLSGLQSGGTFYGYDDTETNNRISRIHPDIECLKINNPTANYAGVMNDFVLTTQSAIVNKIIDITQWTSSTATDNLDNATSGHFNSYATAWTKGKWSGKTDTDWFKCSNWEGMRVPTEETDVIIDGTGSPNAGCEIDATDTYFLTAQYYDFKANCKDITISGGQLEIVEDRSNVLNVKGNLLIETGGKLDMNNNISSATIDGTLNLYGNWTNNGNFSEGESLVVFMGTGTQTVNCSGNEAFAYVDVNGGGTVSLNTNTITEEDLWVINGTWNNNANGLNMGGNLNVHATTGTFTAGTSTTTFIGNSPQNIRSFTGTKTTATDNSNPITFNNLKIANTSTSDVVLKSPIVINGDLTIGVPSHSSASSTSALNSNDNNIDIKGNWINNKNTGIDGFKEQSLSIVTFNGTAAQSISKTNGKEAFAGLVFNNTAGITLNTEVEVQLDAEFTNGVVTSSSTNPLVFTADASATGAKDASHVAGPVRKETPTTMAVNFIYPVGKNGQYRPLAITEKSDNVASSFTAEYFNAGYGNYTIGTPTELDHVSDKEYWNLDRTSGTSNAKIALYWDENSGVATPTDTRVAHFKSNKWEREGNTEGVAGATEGQQGKVTSDFITTFSPFTLGSTSNTNPLPIELFEIELKHKQGETELTWTTLSEINASHFEVERSFDGLVFEKVGKIIAKGNETTSTSYSFQEIVNEKTDIIYYRLKMVDLDATYEYSKVVSASIYQGEEIYIYPNPTQDILHIKGKNIHSIKISSLTGKTLKNILHHSEETSISTQNLPKGVYFMQCHNRNQEVLHSIRIVKE